MQQPGLVPFLARFNGPTRSILLEQDLVDTSNTLTSLFPTEL